MQLSLSQILAALQKPLAHSVTFFVMCLATWTDIFQKKNIFFLNLLQGYLCYGQLWWQACAACHRSHLHSCYSFGTELEVWGRFRVQVAFENADGHEIQRRSVQWVCAEHVMWIQILRIIFFMPSSRLMDSLWHACLYFPLIRFPAVEVWIPSPLCQWRLWQWEASSMVLSKAWPRTLDGF